ncbi:hypothetical protein [Celeribacter sp.]|uniref:hypothetical protein n=1 Tax=Celeribacter sp. TaxID=1890673 RepID=UPI003A9031FB
MKRHQILSQPMWKHFLHIEDVFDLPLPALMAADQVWKQAIAHGAEQPTACDYAQWAQISHPAAPHLWLSHLCAAFEVILPSELNNIAAAAALLPKPALEPAPVTEDQSVDWAPCHYKPDARSRKVSVHPWELPYVWQEVLRRAAHGFPGKKTAAPAPDILHRMCEKLCQFTWSAREAGFEPAISEDIVTQYLTDLEGRLRQRPHGIRWATMRATVEELHRFARYSGLVSDEDTKYLSKRLTRYSLYEKGQDALKFQALLDTGNTTLGLLEKADALLLRARFEASPTRRYLLRNAGAVLGLFSIVPLRNADARLTFGETLVWEADTWVIDTAIKKTRSRNTDHLVVPLEPEFARYIDAVVQGDHDARHLPELRTLAVQRHEPLIKRNEGKYTSPTYIPRLFKTFAGTSFTTTRTMLHTDQAIQRGETGTRDAMVMAQQTSPETAKKYQAKRVRQVAVQRVQAAASDRREALMPDDLIRQIRALTDQQDSRNADL